MLKIVARAGQGSVKFIPHEKQLHCLGSHRLCGHFSKITTVDDILSPREGFLVTFLPLIRGQRLQKIKLLDLLGILKNNDLFALLVLFGKIQKKYFLEEKN